jgi:nucleotide-binding universal stress UspA family protein
MQLRHILAATDESDAGRQAVRTAIALASRTHARITVLRVSAVEATRRRVSVGIASENEADETAERYLRRWLAADVLSPAESATVKVATAAGIPGIEICRFAEQNEVDLVILGRKRHSTMMRLLLGDTADAVARRSRVPCLFTPPGAGDVSRILVALDGSDRGINVLTEACDLAKAAGAELMAMTVEQTPGSEPLHIVSDLPVARSVSLENVVREVLARERMPDTPRAGGGAGDWLEGTGCRLPSGRTPGRARSRQHRPTAGARCAMCRSHHTTLTGAWRSYDMQCRQDGSGGQRDHRRDDSRPVRGAHTTLAVLDPHRTHSVRQRLDGILPALRPAGLEPLPACWSPTDIMMWSQGVSL